MTIRRVLGVVPAALFASALTLSQATGAFAATQTLGLGFSGTSSPISIVPSTTVSCCSGAVSVTFDVHAVVNWVTAPDPVAVNYTPGLLRQGSNPDITLTNTPGAGSMNVTYTADVSGSFNSIGSFGPDIFTLTQTVPCTMPLTFDPAGSCSGTTDLSLLTVGDCSLLGGATCLVLDIPVTTTVSVGSEPVTSVRHAVIAGGQTIPDANLTFNGPSGTAISDPIDNTVIPCTDPAGADFTYALNNNGYSTQVSLGISASLHAFVEVTDITIFNGDLYTFAVGPFGPASLSMTAASQTVDLGTIQPDVTPPTLTASVATASPAEGFPVSFLATATDTCGAPIVTWNFSDGGVAYGLNPQHTFQDAATYSVLVTAKNVLGLTTQQTLSVVVGESPPSVSAGPPMTTEWGLPVSFHANGSAPGAVDNANLLYTWNFNDPAAPVGAAGQNVSHTFSLPGTYAVVATVVDDNPAETANSTVTVNVLKRGTTLLNTSATSGEVTDPVTLQAVLLDDQGGAVAGRQVQFFLDGGTTPIATATTDTSGVAQSTYTFAAGMSNVRSHTIVASFAGDSLFNASTSSASTLTINKETTALTYTGPSSSRPASSPTVSAVLKDDSGDPVAGKSVTFRLGETDDTCSVMTNSSGVASCTIHLDEKPGSYQMIVTFAGDPDYSSSLSSTAFTIGMS